MDTLINEGLMIVSTLIVLPIMAVLTLAFFAGKLTKTEQARFLAVREDDADYWTAPEHPLRNRAKPASSTIRGGAGA